MQKKLVDGYTKHKSAASWGKGGNGQEREREKRRRRRRLSLIMNAGKKRRVPLHRPIY